MQLQEASATIRSVIAETSQDWWQQLSELCVNWVPDKDRMGAIVRPEGWELVNVVVTLRTVTILVHVVATVGWRRLHIPAKVIVDSELGVSVTEPAGAVFEPDEEFLFLQTAAFNATLPAAIKLSAEVQGFRKNQILLLNEENHRYQSVDTMHDAYAPAIAGSALVAYPQLYKVLRSFP